MTLRYNNDADEKEVMVKVF